MSRFMPDFNFRTASVQVHFSAGARHHLRDVVEESGCRRVLLLSTSKSKFVQELADGLRELAAGHFAGARAHTPVDVTELAMRTVEREGIDCLVAIGGGSTIGLAKALAYRTGLPQVAIPTTYAGSEATPILGQTENGQKTTLVDRRVQPGCVIYDPELMTTLPVAMTGMSALNAIAHAAEGLYAGNRNPVSSLLAIEGISAFAEALPRVINAPGALEPRGETLYGAWLCGTVLGQVGMALHHKLCHTLGGAFDIPHAETHAVILAHALAYNEIAVPDLLRPLANIFSADSAAQAIAEFGRRIGAPTALRDLGLDERDLDKAADMAVAKPYWNPRPVERDAIFGLLRRAWAGEEPQG